MRASGGDAVEDGRGDEVAAGQVGGAGAAEDEAGARRAAVVDVAGDLGVLLVGDERAEVAVVAAGADGDARRAGVQALDQRVGDGLLDQELGGGGADLAGIAEGAVGQVLDQPVEVGVGEDQDGVLAAELQHDRDRALGRHRHDRAAGRDRAGEGDAADQRVADQRRARLLAEAGDDVEHAGRQAGLERQLGQAQGGERRLLGGLEHGRAAGGEGRGQRAGGHARADSSRARYGR